MNSPVVDDVRQRLPARHGRHVLRHRPGRQRALDAATLLPPNPDEHPATPIIAADGTIYIETGTDGASLTSAAQLYHIDADDRRRSSSRRVRPPGRCDVSVTAWRRQRQRNGCGADGFDVNPSIGNDGMLFDGDDFGQTVTYTLNAGGTFTQTNEVILPLLRRAGRRGASTRTTTATGAASTSASA